MSAYKNTNLIALCSFLLYNDFRIFTHDFILRRLRLYIPVSCPLHQTKYDLYNGLNLNNSVNLIFGFQPPTG